MGGVILLLMITVVLCIVILCMRRYHRKGKFPVDDKVYYDLTDVHIDHNPSYVVTTPEIVEYSTIKPRDSTVSITSNPSYFTSNTSNVPTKPYSEDEYNYVQPNEFNQHSDLEDTIKMDTNPSYGVTTGGDKATVFSTTSDTKADHSSHDATTEEYDYAYVHDDHLLHHNYTAVNTTGDTKITRSPYLTLISNGVKVHNGSAAK